MATWPVEWSARWIWAGRPVDRPGGTRTPPPETWNRFCFLRRSFTLEEVPPETPARVTADSRYVLWLNGREVARGPARAVPERLSWCEIDLTPRLVEGENVLGALVRFYGRPNPWWQPAAAAGFLGFGGFLFEAPRVGVVSDRGWRAHTAPYVSHVGQPMHGLPDEVIDGTAWPVGWNVPGFDDAGWASATELENRWPPSDRPSLPGPPYTAPERAEIAPLTSLPVVLDLLHERPLVFDANRIVLATPWIEVEGPPGSTVAVTVGEDLRPDGSVESSPRDWALRYTLAGRRGGERVDAFEAVGFRYFGAATTGGAVVHGVGAIERRYPTEPGAAFSCDDPRLEQIWRTGARTLEVCSTDAFLDCPGREQRAWLGDAYVHGLLTYVTNSDWRLVARHLNVGAQSRRADGLLAMAAVGDLSLGAVTIPDYSLHWIRMLARWVERTGDRDAVADLVAVADGVASAFERFRGANGLLTAVPGWVFIDWAATERSDVVTALDALYALACDDLAFLHGTGSSEAAGHTRDALDLMWDDVRGVWADCAGPNGPHFRVSQQTNALCALAMAATQPDRARRALEYVLDRERLAFMPTTADVPAAQALLCQYVDPAQHHFGFDPQEHVIAAQPFFRHFLHAAVAAVGWGDRLPDLCLDWWPQIERGATTFEEFWRAPSGRASRAHAWSSTPTWDLTTHVLGVRCEGPDRFVVDPHLGRLEWAAGTVPTRRGPMTVRVEGNNTDIDVPDGIEVATV